jgi:alanine dehydrogenase
MQNDAGGKGVLLGGIAGVPPAEVIIIGAGAFGKYATRAFLGMGAHVTLMDKNLVALQQVYDEFPGVVTRMSNQHNLERICSYADVIVAAILVPGKQPPTIITREMVKMMKPRSLIMDISIDEGGCIETSRPTTHEHPTFVEEGVIHCTNIQYCCQTSTLYFISMFHSFWKSPIKALTMLSR